MSNNPNNRSRVYGPQMRDQAVPLFTELSTGDTSPLMVIRGKNPVITAYNLPSDAIIWIEMVELTELHVPWREGCCIKDFPPQEVISVNRIRCSQCTADTDAQQLEQFARITTKNPVVELNLPYGTYWQLRWDGPGLGDVFVRLWESHRSFDASQPTVTNGCPCIQYIDDPAAWIPNNVIRCNEATGNVEGEFRDPNNNQTAWFVVEPILWRDTGATREYCDPAIPVPNPDSPDPVATADESYEKQQINQCGYVRWVNANCMYWTATGNDREYDPTSDTNFERQMVNQFGRFRWDDEPSMVWTATGEERELCVPDDTDFERRFVNQFGRSRWDIESCMNWSDTGEYRSVCPDTNDDYEKQQVNQFGRFRWVAVDCVNWTVTGKEREFCIPDDTDYEIEESNQYGGTQWVASTCAMVWWETGQKKELCPDDTNFDLKYELQEVNKFGRTRWVEALCDMVWEDTGETREIQNFTPGDPSATPPTEDIYEVEDALYEKQQVNNFGRFRWIEATIPMEWSKTGKYIVEAGFIKWQEVNQFGRFRWVDEDVFIAPVVFIPAENFGQTTKSTSSSATDTTVDTVVVTEYETTAVVLEKGYGFIASDPTADPDATILVPHPVTGAANTVAIYPTPRPEATVEVFDTLAVGTRVLLGYARNNPLGLIS